MYSVFKKHVSIRGALLYQVQIPMAFFKMATLDILRLAKIKFEDSANTDLFRQAKGVPSAPTPTLETERQIRTTSLLEISFVLQL